MHAIDLRAWLFLLHAILSVAIACMVLGSPLVLPELMGHCHTPCAVEYDGASPWGTPVKASFPQLTYPSEVLQPHCHHPPSGPAPACVPSAPQLSMPSFAVPLCAVPLTPPAANARRRIASECVYTVQRQPRKMHARTGEQLRTFGGEVTEPIDELGHERRRPPKRGTCARERERGSLVPTCARSRDAAPQHPRARLCGFGD